MAQDTNSDRERPDEIEQHPAAGHVEPMGTGRNLQGGSTLGEEERRVAEHLEPNEEDTER